MGWGGRQGDPFCQKFVLRFERKAQILLQEALRLKFSQRSLAKARARQHILHVGLEPTTYGS